MTLEEIVDGFDQGYLVTSADGTITAISARAADLINVDPGAAVGRPAAEVLPLKDAEGQPLFDGPGSALARTVAGTEPWQTSLRGLDLDNGGEARALSLRLVPHSGGGALVLVGDAAPLREVLEAHDALLSITSHELKTPLTAIKAMSELMLAYELGEEQRKEMIGDIYRQAERLEELIREILDASQIDSGKIPLDIRELDLKELLATVIEELETQLQGRKLSVGVPAGLPRVLADWAKLRQVIVNLLTNAIKYSPEGAPVRLTASHHSDMVRVDVKDSGIGIRPEDLGRLFKKFQRIPDPSTRKTSGTGLGLYIVKGLIELQGGEVEAKSTYGKGSTFSFSIPSATR